MLVVMTSAKKNKKKLVTLPGLTVNSTMLESHTMQCGHSVIRYYGRVILFFQMLFSLHIYSKLDN